MYENYFGDETDVENAMKYLQDNYPNQGYGMNILGDFPLIVGAGISTKTTKEQLTFSDGAIAGSYFKEYGEAAYPVDAARVKEFIYKARGGL